MFAITAAAMLAMIGLLYSFGIVLNQRRSLQSAADAASLAGTWQILTELASDNRSDANVVATVQRFAVSNGASSAAVSGVYVDASAIQVGILGSGGQFPYTARGVRISVSGNVPTILPGFLNSLKTVVQDSATATARPTVPPTASAVVPLAVSTAAYSAHATYDLFANPPSGSTWATLDLSSAGAPTFATPSTNEQYWSDGQHFSTWQLTQPTSVRLAGAAYYDSVAAGLLDNVRRQALVDASNKSYALITVPIYDSVTSSPAAVHVVGFAQMKIVGSTITATSAPATFVPYPAAAFGLPQTPTFDVGASLIILTS